MSILEPSKIAFSSGLPIDQVMTCFTFQMSLPNGGSSYSTEIAVNRGTNAQGQLIANPFQNGPMWVGRFSTDNTNWSPLDGVIFSGSNYVAAAGSMQGASFLLNAQNTTSSSVTLYVEVALIATSTFPAYTPPTEATPAPTVSSGNAFNTAWSSNSDFLLFDSRQNYMKIASQGSESFTITENTINDLTIPHNLGYVPYALIQFEYENFIFLNLSSATQVTGLQAVPVTSYVYMDTSNIYIASGLNASNSYTVNVYWRIYYDVN